MALCQILEDRLKTVIVDHDATQKQRQDEVCHCYCSNQIKYAFTLSLMC